jgi:hypothetical protein
MEQFVGLDVSQELTHLCVVDSNGAIVWQGKCDSTPAVHRRKHQSQSALGGTHSLGERCAPPGIGMRWMEWPAIPG